MACCMDARCISMELTFGETCSMHQVWFPGLLVDGGDPSRGCRSSGATPGRKRSACRRATRRGRPSTAVSHGGWRASVFLDAAGEPERIELIAPGLVVEALPCVQHRVDITTSWQHGPDHIQGDHLCPCRHPEVSLAPAGLPKSSPRCGVRTAGGRRGRGRCVVPPADRRSR